jgi:hypothetical protein
MFLVGYADTCQPGHPGISIAVAIADWINVFRHRAKVLETANVIRSS